MKHVFVGERSIAMSIIRLATETDISFIDTQLYPFLHDSHQHSEEHIRSVVLSGDYFLAVADEGTWETPVLLGAAALHIIVQSSAGPKGYIDDLVVVPAARRKGVGRRIFEFLEDIARGCGAAKIFFTCAPWREPGNKFHVAMGYELRSIAADENGTNYYEKVLA